jgi:hypothetical protein
MAMARSLEETLISGQRLRQVLLSISGQAERDLRLLSSHPPHTCIHALRVRMKKILAILRLIEPGVAPATMKAIRRGVRALKRAFAMNRDQHVLNALLVELSDGGIVCRKECSAPGNRDGTYQLPGKVQQRRLKATAHALTRRLRAMRLHPLALDDIAEAYALRYAKARRWFRRCERNPSSACLHHWRAPVKDHYFQSLLVLRDRQRLSASRKIGGWLGQMHDLDMLFEHSNHVDSECLAQAIRRRMKKLRARIFHKARRLFKFKPGKLSHQVRAAHTRHFIIA